MPATRALYGYDGAVGSLDDVRSGFARERAGSSSSSGRAGHATYTRKRSEDARRFAASAAAAQGALTAELFGTGGGARGGARGGRSAGRYESPALRGPTAEHITDGFLEVFPRGNDRKPALLGQLESLLAEKLRLTEKLTESSGADAEATDALRLEAYRQTFEAFINAFSTYRPLLTKVKEHYDRALDRASIRAENAALRAEVAASERRRAREVESARAATNAGGEPCGDATKRALAAEARAAAAGESREAVAREAAAEARAAAAVEAAAASEAARVTCDARRRRRRAGGVPRATPSDCWRRNSVRCRRTFRARTCSWQRTREGCPRSRDRSRRTETDPGAARTPTEARGTRTRL